MGLNLDLQQNDPTQQKEGRKRRLSVTHHMLMTFLQPQLLGIQKILYGMGMLYNICI